MNRISLLFIMIITLFITGCSNGELKQLTYDDIKDLPLKDQVQSIIENTEFVEEFEVVIEDNSVAIIYHDDYVPDSTLVLSNKKESFPNVAMTFVEHLKALDFDEVVITSYKPSDADGITGMTRVSSLFVKETIDELDFEKWNDDKDSRPQRFYRHSDAYLIRGNVWDKLNDETKEKVANNSKSSDSQFWDYYGSYVE